jgi:aldehyde reductase
LDPVDDKGKMQYSNADIVDTWPAMEKCVELGLVRSIGISNFNIEQMSRILKIAKIKPTVNQVNSSIIYNHDWHVFFQTSLYFALF